MAYLMLENLLCKPCAVKTSFRFAIIRAITAFFESFLVFYAYLPLQRLHLCL